MTGEPLTPDEQAKMYDPRIAMRMIDLVFGAQDDRTIAELREEARKLIKELDKP